MKSALELAMERSDSLIDKDQVKLTPEQVAAVDEVKREYEAKWAEQEIVLNERIRKISTQEDPQTFAEHRGQFEEEKRRVREQIFEDRDQKIAQIVNRCWIQRWQPASSQTVACEISRFVFIVLVELDPYRHIQ